MEKFILRINLRGLAMKQRLLGFCGLFFCLSVMASAAPLSQLKVYLPPKTSRQPPVSDAGLKLCKLYEKACGNLACHFASPGVVEVMTSLKSALDKNLAEIAEPLTRLRQDQEALRTINKQIQALHENPSLLALMVEVTDAPNYLDQLTTEASTLTANIRGLQEDGLDPAAIGHVEMATAVSELLMSELAIANTLKLHLASGKSFMIDPTRPDASAGQVTLKYKQSLVFAQVADSFQPFGFTFISRAKKTNAVTFFTENNVRYVRFDQPIRTDRGTLANAQIDKAMTDQHTLSYKKLGATPVERVSILFNYLGL